MRPTALRPAEVLIAHPSLMWRCPCAAGEQPGLGSVEIRLGDFGAIAVGRDRRGFIAEVFQIVVNGKLKVACRSIDHCRNRDGTNAPAQTGGEENRRLPADSSAFCSSGEKDLPCLSVRRVRRRARFQ